MIHVGVDVGIGTYLHIYAHNWLDDTETYRIHRVLVVHFLVDVNLVVAAQQQAMVTVGQTESVVVVQHFRVDRLLVVVNQRHPVDACHIVACVEV